jgi:phosphatidylglycerol---prolipoprotein diacylglyceryl transferase
MDNRATRRRAAAASRRGNAGSTAKPGPGASSGTMRDDASRRAANERPPSEAVEPEALVVSHRFDPGETGERYSATIRLTGRRIGVQGMRTSQDDFVRDDKVEHVLPGSGPVSITTWVYGLRPGEWTVDAELLRPQGGRRREPATAESIGPAKWSSRRWALSAGSSGLIKTRWAILAPLARIPGVIPGSWPALGALAVVVALLAQAAVLAHKDIAFGQPQVVFLIALASGMIAAKLWYAILHPGPWRQAILGGWAVDGFLVVAPIVAVAVLLVFKLPVGAFLDATAPGLFVGVAIGRVGCFLAGCCAGHISRSRWGVWSSDRRVGARRVPAQLLESAAGLVIAVVAALLIFGHTLSIDGAIFVGAFAAYFLARQALLRVRAERREFSWQRRATTLAEGAQGPSLA